MTVSKQNSLKFAQDLLLEGQGQYWRKLNYKSYKQLIEEYQLWLQSDDTGIDAPQLSLLSFMLYQIDRHKTAYRRLQKASATFSRLYLKSIDEIERREHILNFCIELGADKKQLKRDKQAFARWFGRDAVMERYHSRQYETQKQLAFYLYRLGYLCQQIIPRQKDLQQFWHRFRIEEVLRPLLAFDGDKRVRESAFKCLARMVIALPEGQQNQMISDATVQYVYRSALERRQNIWIQCEALSMLKALSPESLQVVLQKRILNIKDNDDKDDIFVRRHGVKIIGECQEILPEYKVLLYSLLDDPSPAVRQMIPQALLNSSMVFIQPVLQGLLLRDKSAAVRVSALLIFPRLYQRGDSFQLIRELLVECFSHEKDEFVLKAALKITLDCLSELEGEHRELWIEQFRDRIQQLHIQAEPLSIRRQAAQTLEWLWLYTDASAEKVCTQLQQLLAHCAEGQRVLLPASIMAHDPLWLGRIMSLLAQQDHSLTLEKGWRGYYLRRGEKFAFRWWRFLHEFRNSSTDKRQSHRHTIGRHYYGLLHTPSGIMSELAETRVPGEPLYISEENASRYYLPLVDQALAALDQGWPTKYFQIVSAEGVTRLLPPENVLQRFRAHLYISSHFAEFSRMRNWQQGDGEPSAYIQALTELGFKVEFIPHHKSHKTDGSQRVDTSVSRFFPALLPLNWDRLVERSEDYFFSVYENTLFHLGIFVALVSAYFFGRHITLNQLMRRARNTIPLVIGGWGTRGKSGTERLKAALFNALGYSVVSKTTGCEAMFLHAPAYGPLREMFLFRPYDKATIWEQVDVVRLSQRMGCDVFLWECMGLTPSYVHVLQRSWMRDDISTITNTYPDHEDLQGPAGYDIPRVMTNFIPRQSTLVTSEEQMLPILRDSARQLKTAIRTVGWLQAGLITEDILQRFPYEEHPYNIALVLEVADELGIERDFAIKEMADNVIADLGVLKTYPRVNISGRQLEFINGMSANERFGALGNWTRMGMQQHSLRQDAEVWVSTVINNRADRVARSQVFASIMVQDISVDRHILIGDNLQGLLGYIREAWHAQALSLFTDEQIRPEQRLESVAIRLRVPVSETEVLNRLRAMLEGSNIQYQPDLLVGCLSQPSELNQLLTSQAAAYGSEIEQQFQRDLENWQAYEKLYKKIQQLKNKDAATDAAFRKLAWQWFEQKLVVVENYHARGDDIVKCIVEQTPPGLLNRLMGMQNIKGTGLDFIYRWQAWDSCHHACEQFYNKDPLLAEEAVRELARFQGFGLLCEEKVIASINDIRDREWTQREEIQAELVLIQNNLQQALETSQTPEKNPRLRSGWIQKLTEYIEAFLDAGDAVKRRKQANLIYKDLIHQRISHERAAAELQLLNKRQKGGWGSEYINRLVEARDALFRK